jgi:hypothetical protein
MPRSKKRFKRSKEPGREPKPRKLKQLSDDPNYLGELPPDMLHQLAGFLTPAELKKLCASNPSLEWACRDYQVSMLHHGQFAKLPPELIRKIAFDLPYRSIVALCNVSKLFNDAVCHNDDFWNAYGAKVAKEAGVQPGVVNANILWGIHPRLLGFRVNASIDLFQSDPIGAPVDLIGRYEDPDDADDDITILLRRHPAANPMLLYFQKILAYSNIRNAFWEPDVVNQGIGSVIKDWNGKHPTIKYGKGELFIYLFEWDASRVKNLPRDTPKTFQTTLPWKVAPGYKKVVNVTFGDLKEIRAL